VTALLDNAGPFVWPILLASVIGLAVFFERWVTFLRMKGSDGQLLTQVVKLEISGRRKEALEACRRERNPVAGVLATTLREMDRPHSEREQIIRATGNHQLQQMERGIRVISVVVRLAPLMGLLGTVVGLVEAFHAVSSVKGPPDPSLLAGGIWQALLTTVAGLLVAIPAIISHEWLLGRVDAMAIRMQVAVAQLLSRTSHQEEDAGDVARD
jgi:biopolymer transport protein ExbB